MTRNTRRAGLSLATAILMFAAASNLQAQDPAGLFADADGIEPPDIGVAYTLPSNSTVAVSHDRDCPGMAALLADADGIEAPDSGMAYAIPVPLRTLAERSGAVSR